MAWNREKTQRIFKLLLLMSIALVVSTISLMIFNLSKSRKQQYFGSFIYVIVILFGTGLGCVWFKIFRAKLTWSHAVIHTLVLILMLASNREMFSLLSDGKINECIRRHSISLLNVCLYIIQVIYSVSILIEVFVWNNLYETDCNTKNEVRSLTYILSFHLMVFRYGRNPSEKAFRSGLHAFGGVLTFFVSFIDAVVVWRRISWEDMSNFYFPLVLVFYLKFGYAVCTWYLVLNPYFDWRRLKALSMQKSSKNLPRKSSRTLGRSPSRT